MKRVARALVGLVIDDYDDLIKFIQLDNKQSSTPIEILETDHNEAKRISRCPKRHQYWKCSKVALISLL